MKNGYILFILLSLLWGAEFTVSFSPDDITLTEVKYYDLVVMKDLTYNTEVGSPSLPVKLINIAIPADTKVKGIKILAIMREEIPGTYNLLPVQPPKYISDKKNTELIGPDPKYYNSPGPYPQVPVTLVGTGDIAGQNLCAVLVYPIQYIPLQKKIVLLREIRFKLITEAGEAPQKIKLTERTKKIYEELLRGMVINPEEINILSGGKESLLLPPGNYEYVIITTSTLEPYWQDLLDWKMRKGVKDTVVTTTWIYTNYSGSDNPTKIRNFIIDANSTWGTIWFLLGGDANLVPIKSKYYVEDWIPGDHFYADYDDDWYCEVFVGRAPVDNSTQINTFVNKVLNYESTPPITNYPLKILLIGMDFDWLTPSEDLKEYIDNNYIPSRFNVTKVYDSQTGNHKTAALNALNSGQNIVNHSDHAYYDVLGVGSYWHDLHLTITDIDNLTNNNKTYCFYSLGCWSNAFDLSSDCIAEHFIVYNPGQAGVAYIGNTRYGWYQLGNPYSLSCHMDREWWRSLFVYNKYRMGESLADSKNRNYPTDDYWRYIIYELALLGDPEMPVWTNTPDTLYASHPENVSVGTTDFTVTVTSGGNPVSDAYVCVYKPGEVYETGYTDANGEITFTISPSTEGTLYVTATKHDHLPYLGEATVISCVYGDANGDDIVNSADLSYLSNFLYYGGPEPTLCGDVNGDCTINSADLSYLANYLYMGGPPPQPPCTIDMVEEPESSIR